MKNGFKIPLQSEVERYMKEKKSWPEKFCSYYAERFYNFYMSNGWKVSGRAAMKDWKAAFNSQWQTLKFKEDIDFFNSCRNGTNAPQGTQEALFLNERLNDHRKRWDKIQDGEYASIYDWMKERKLIKMTLEEKEQAKQYCNGNVVKGKALAVRLIFNRMITNAEHF